MLKVLGATISNIVSQVTTLLGFVYPCFKALVLTICTTICNNQKLCMLPAHCIYVFSVIFTVNSNYFHKRH